MPVVNYDWDELEDNIVEEFDDVGNTLAEYTTEPDLFGNVISQNRQGVESQFHFDALGSTLAVTDENQQMTDTCAYSAFGDSTETEGGTAFPFHYVGRSGYRASSSSNAIEVRQRKYQPINARWMSVDPLLLRDSDNPYKYASNSPLITMDPSGLLMAPINPLPDNIRCHTVSYCKLVAECSFARPDSPGRWTEFVDCSESELIECCRRHARNSVRGALVALATPRFMMVEETRCTVTTPRTGDVDAIGGCIILRPEQIPISIARIAIPRLLITLVPCPVTTTTTIERSEELLPRRPPKPRTPEEEYCFDEANRCLHTGLADEDYGGRCYNCWLKCNSLGGEWSGIMTGTECDYWNYPSTE
jgi:RHS repeat-associated protein